MYTNPRFRSLGIIYRVLGNERRLTILLLLSGQSYNVLELTEMLGISGKATSKHLHRLLSVRLIEGKRHKQEVRFRIAKGWNIGSLLSGRNLSNDRFKKGSVDIL